MTSKVFEFLNDSGGNNFTETAPRPPVPGEENELQSNGGMSTRSSGSHKSQISNKSHASSKSAASTKGEISHSPAATPRKSNLERGDAISFPLCRGFETEDMEAPLGFEPEGSAANSPPYSENSTPPHLKWAENLNYLLTDSDGVSLFKEYLEREQGGADELQFWFACQGLKQKADTDVAFIVKVIYKTYVRAEKVKSISKDTKKEIVEKIQQRVKVDQCIFDAAQAEVENHLRNVSYPAFLNSDIYVQYVQSYADSPKSSHSSGSNSARPVSQSVLLPVLHEDKELATDELSCTMGVPLINKITGGRRSEFTSLRHQETVTGFYPYVTRTPCSPYPAHVSYAPVSAQDSEQQSLSSDALTDDAVSLTDTSSIDGNMTYSRKRHRKGVKNFAIHNRENRTDLNSQFIPRTQRVPNPKDQNIAETNPEQFAHLLRMKLEKELEEREAHAKVDEKLKVLNQGDVQEENINISFAKNTTAASFILSLPPEEETAESILDQHCSRIWASSHHTPSRSPGRMSPHSKSPDRAFARPKAKAAQQSVGAAATAAAAASASSANTSFQRNYHRSSKRDFPGLSKSFDSNMGETHRHIHHHHHHHHTREISVKQRVELESPQMNVMSWREGSVCFDHTHGRTNVKKSAVRKGSDASSNIDSGINMGFDRESARVVPNWNNPSSEKVMKWMLQSETIISDTVTGSVDADRNSHKRSHRYSSGGAPLQPYKQSSKGKTGTHTSSRSASVERSGMHAWGVAGVVTPVLPNQPFVQDSNMPLLTPPNPTTQLEEAKRRLEDQSRTTVPVKSKSFAGVPVKDKSRCGHAATPVVSPHIPSARTVPSDLDASTTMPEYSQRPQRPPGSGVQTDTTVVGMYYEQEPIPYRFTLPGRSITLAQVRALNTKRGSYKYFFKRDSNEFGDGAVFEEIDDDSKILPMWDGKIVVKLVKVD